LFSLFAQLASALHQLGGSDALCKAVKQGDAKTALANLESIRST
jgi:hypothetical protein